jgi:hypothetical protein
MNAGDPETVLDQLRRELRPNAGFRKLTDADQRWLVERLAISDFGTIEQLHNALTSRTAGHTPICRSSLFNLRERVQKKLLLQWNLAAARKQIVDRLTAGAVVATDIERLAQSALPGITQAIAGLLGDRALSLVGSGADPEEARQVLSDFLSAASGARADRDLTRREAEAALQRARFQRDTCEMFLRWASDQRAADIAAGQGSNAEKIDRLGQLMFGDSWAPPPAAHP